MNNNQLVPHEPNRRRPGYGGEPDSQLARIEAKLDHVLTTPGPAFAGADSAMRDDLQPSKLWMYLQTLRHRKRTVVAATAAGILLAVLISMAQTKVYRAKATLEIVGINEDFMRMKEVDPTATAGYSSENYIQTQADILQSHSLVARVAAKLRLPEQPEFKGRPGRLDKVRALVGIRSVQTPTTVDGVAGRVSKNLLVQPRRGTTLIDVQYDCPDPVLAAQVVNALSTAFVDYNLELRAGTRQQTRELLQRELDSLKSQLKEAEDNLQSYAQSTNLVFTNDNNSVAEQRLRQLQEELSRVQAERMTRQSQAELASSTPPEALPEVLDNSNLHGYQAKLADLKRELADLTATYTSNHYKVKRVEAQIAELEALFTRERSNVVGRSNNEYRSALRREMLLSSAYNAQSKLVSEQAAKAVHYNLLKQQVETYRRLFDDMTQKVNEAGIAPAVRASHARLVDAAKTPGGPYKPNLPLNTALGFIAGLFLGCALVIMQDQTDRTLKSPGDSNMYLNVPELGVIPVADAETTNLLTIGSGLKNGAARTSVELTTWRDGSSVLAESVRATLTSILFSTSEEVSSRVIVITSPGPGEGKSTVISNLAIALAEIHRRVLVIDADLRRPRLHDIFKVPNTWGLSYALSPNTRFDETTLDSLALGTEVKNLSIIPAGPNRVNGSTALHSTRVPKMMEYFRSRYDIVLVDTPPLLHMSDARLLGRLADTVILVIRAGKTTRGAAKAAWERFAADGTPVLGTILNGWDPRSAAGSYYENAYKSAYRYVQTGKE